MNDAGIAVVDEEHLDRPLGLVALVDARAVVAVLVGSEVDPTLVDVSPGGAVKNSIKVIIIRLTP